MQEMIFVVDDQDTNLSTAELALEELYRIITLPSAEKMFEMLERVKPDLILLDIEMSGMDGFEALRRMKADERFAGIPVIFLTGSADTEMEVRGFELGAVDFVAKPFSAPVLRNRIKTHLRLRELVHEQTRKLERLQNELVFILADFVEGRDTETGDHIERTSRLVKILVEAILARGLFPGETRGWDAESLAKSARLHDIGKIFVPRSILNKLGSLTHEEFELLKSHAAGGEHLIEKIIKRTGDVPFLQCAKLFAGSHHERWDGSGYPNKLKGEEIPLPGRILAVVDVYDAMLSNRQYLKTHTEEEVFQLIASNAGKLFDPRIVKVFMDIKDDISAARKNYV